MTNLEKIQKMPAKQMADFKSIMAIPLCLMAPSSHLCQKDNLVSCWKCRVQYLKEYLPAYGKTRIEVISTADSEELAKMLDIHGCALVHDFCSANRPCDTNANFDCVKCIREWLESEATK